MSQTESTDVALIEVPGGIGAVTAFTGDYEITIGPLLKRIRMSIDDFMQRERNLADPAQRDEIKSFAYRIARSKTALDDAGKRVVDDLKALPRKVDANRKLARDTLDAWRDEVRQPVEEFERAEAARVDTHRANLKEIGDISANLFGLPVEQLQTRAKRVADFALGVLDEFADEYAIACEAALARLAEAGRERQRYDADQIELGRLRAAQAEREAKEREADEIRMRAEFEEQRQQREEQAERDRAARAEAEAKAAEERAARQAAEAEAAALRKAEADRLRKELEAAAAKAAEDRAAAAKAARKGHQAMVNTVAVKALIDAMMTADEHPSLAGYARAIVTAIAKGEIPNVTIQY